MSVIKQLIAKKVNTDREALAVVRAGIARASRELQALEARGEEIARTVSELEEFLREDETPVKPLEANAEDDAALRIVADKHTVEQFNTYGMSASSHIPDRWERHMIMPASDWLERMNYDRNVSLGKVVAFANAEWKRYCLAAINGGKAEADKIFRARFKDDVEGYAEAKRYLESIGVEAHTSLGILHEANKRYGQDVSEQVIC